MDNPEQEDDLPQVETNSFSYAEYKYILKSLLDFKYTLILLKYSTAPPDICLQFIY